MSSRVRKANKATASQLSSVVTDGFDLGDVRYSIQLATASELSDMDQESIWNIFEQNMRHLYAKSSMGWNPPSKKLELFHRDSRFVVMRRPQAEDHPDSLCAEVPIVAYSMFRFDMEDNECVLYWYFATFNFILRYPIPLGHSFKLSSYELQVSQSVQRGGIGKTLMKCLYDIARGWKMQKVMLTVFKENQAAFLFYKTMGFNAQSDEEWVDEDKDVDYWIMSKGVTI